MAALAVEKPAEEPWQENLNSHLVCPDCREVPPNLVEEYSSGDVVCGDCGLVLGARIIDFHSEWRTFANDDQNNDDPSRVGDGPNMLLNGEQLQTSIGFADGSKIARDLNRAQNKTVQDKGNKALMQAYKHIQAMCDSMHLESKVCQHAKHLYKIVHDQGAFRGKQADAVIASIIFISCRQFKVGRSFREIHSVTTVPRKEVGRIFKALEKFFEEHNSKIGVIPDTSNTAATTPAELCTRYTSQLHLDVVARMTTEKLAEKVNEAGTLAGRSPLSVAAACIYFTSHLMRDSRTAKEIAAVCGVSDGTIRTAYKYLYDAREKLVDPAWLKDKDGKVKGDIGALPKP